MFSFTKIRIDIFLLIQLVTIKKLVKKNKYLLEKNIAVELKKCTNTESNNPKIKRKAEKRQTELAEELVIIKVSIKRLCLF